MSNEFTRSNKNSVRVTGWVFATFTVATLVTISVMLTYVTPEMLVWIFVGIVSALSGLLAVVTVPIRIKRRIKYLSLLVIFVILPFQNTLNLIVGFSIRTGILVLIALFFIDTTITLILSRKKRVKLNHFEVASFALMLLAVLYLPGAAAAGSLVGGVYSILRRFQGFFAFFIVRNLHLKEKQVKRLLLVMLIPLLIMVAYAIPEFLWGRYQLIDWLVANSTHPYVQAYVQGEEQIGYYRQYRGGSTMFRAQSFELAFLAFGYSGHILSCVLLATAFLSRRWHNKRWLWLAVLIAVLGTSASVTLSSLTVILITFGVVGLVSWLHRGNAKFVWLSAIGLGVIGILAGGIVGQIFFPDQMALIIERIVHLDTVRRLAYHIDSAGVYFRSISNDRLLIGKGTGVPVMQRYFGLENYVENQYLSDLIAWGVLGPVMYLLFMLSLFALIIRVRRRYAWGSLGYALSVGLFCIAIGHLLIGFSHIIWGATSTDIHFLTLLALLTQGHSFFEDVGLSRHIDGDAQVSV